MKTVGREILLAIRSLRRARGFAFAVIGALALGIGANTAIFSIANAMLLRPLPLRKAGELVHVSEWLSRSEPWGSLSPAEYAALRERKDVFTDMAVSVGAKRTILVGGHPEELQGTRVSPEFLSVVGVEPIVGRRLLPEDWAAGAPATILVSSRLWHRRLGGRPKAIGQTLRLNEELCEVVGVMPPDWERVDDSDFWRVYRLEDDLANPNHFLGDVVARVRPGLSLREAEAALSGGAGRLRGEGKGLAIHLVPMRRYLVGDFWSPLIGLIGAAGFVLLIACANVANLLLARANGRQREIGIRKALGAGSTDLAVHSLAEAGLLAVAGTAAALPLSVGAMSLIRAAAPADIWQLRTVALDGRVLAFCALLALATSLVFGLVPVLWSARVSPGEALRANRSSAGSLRRRRSVAGLLVVSEVALALPLLMAAGLMIRSLWHIQHADLGLARENLVVGEIWLPRYRYPDEPPRRAFFRQLLERMRGQPGLESAGITSFRPLAPFGYEHRPVRLPGRADPAGEEFEAMEKIVDGGYFQTVGIPLLRGRSFTELDDARSQAVALVTESCSRRFFPSGDAVGQSLEVWFPFPAHRWEPVAVVGVVGDVASWPETRVDPGIYLPYGQQVVATMSLVVRSSSGLASAGRAIQREVLAIDPDQLVEVRPWTEVLSGEIASPRFLAVLLEMFAALGLALAGTGTYAVMSALVARRRIEIGIRTALGARRRDVVALFVGQSIRWGAAGVLLGAAVALGSTKLLASLLFGVSPTDAVTLALGAGFLVLAGALGAYVPARAGARVDPMIALRGE